MQQTDYQYTAFISYRHVERDRKWAAWLLQALETYKVPKELQQAGFPARLGKIFRDKEEIPASSDLSDQIKQALEVSRFLIVICSKDTPESKWVSREVELFQEMGRGDKILALLVDGEPSEAFPQRLRFIEQAGRQIEQEPIAADVRPRSDKSEKDNKKQALLRIVAGLLGCSFDQLAQRQQQREKKQKRQKLILAMSLVLALLSGGGWWWDFTRIKTSYYTNYGNRFGVPFGVGELSESQATERWRSYKIESQRGLVRSFAQVNSAGVAQPYAANEGDVRDYQGVSWQLRYTAKGQLAEIDFIDKNNNTITTHVYRFIGNQASVQFSQGTGFAKQFQSAKQTGLFLDDDSNTAKS